ncbi:enoyl-CoA hydratase/isomerase family protein [Arthrobacter sp. LAPM80]|uniref:enoyl-CoA hydratase/isomerase family protein n=1 Tax=Arthrobacter sp. LAPM80 TaxID=3141788 RepID=UPI00398B615A
MSYKQILVRRDGPLVWLTLNRPAEANAISTLMSQEFITAIEEAEADASCHVLILQGAGKYFCAGGDVAMMAGAADPAGFLGQLAATMHEALLLLAASRLVTIAVVQGVAAGAGLGLVLNSDIVLASPRAGFLTAYGAVGLTPDCGVSYLLPMVVGPRRATQMSLLGGTVGAAQALQWGLVSEIVEETGLIQRAAELGEQLGSGATQVLGPTKRLLAGRRASDYAAHLADEAATITTMIAHPQTHKSIAAFVAQRGK